MKHKITILIVFLICLSTSGFTQNKFRKYVADHQIDTNYLKSIDADNFREILPLQKGKLTWVVIFTNSCPGTKYVLGNVKKTISEYKDVNVMLCSSAPYRRIPELMEVLKKNEITFPTVYIINSDRHKDKRFDEREKGFLFRKEICEECRKDIIGVPYSIIYNDAGTVIQYGYIHSEELFPLFDKHSKEL